MHLSYTASKFTTIACGIRRMHQCSIPPVITMVSNIYTTNNVQDHIADVSKVSSNAFSFGFRSAEVVPCSVMSLSP